MYEPQGESDEDCEVYFLKPVNEYNIVDKIKEANKELFSDNVCEQKLIENIEISESSLTKLSTTLDITFATTNTSTTINTIRKVTFAPNLEDYEPEIAAASNGESEAEPDTETEANANARRGKIKANIDKFPTIDEQEECSNAAAAVLVDLQLEHKIDELDDNLNHPRATTLGEASEAKQKKPKNSTTLLEQHDYADHNDDIDEICEEIIIMEMDSITTTTANSTNGNANATTAAATATKLSKEDSLQNRRLVHNRQTTFDYDEEQDNKSLTNLLTASDCEDEQQPCTDDSDAANDASIFMGIDDFDDDVDDDNDNSRDMDNNNAMEHYAIDYDDDDDDKLSLIVASYLPDDYERKANMTPSSQSSSSPGAGASGKSMHNNSYTYFRRGCNAKRSNKRHPPSANETMMTLRTNSNSTSSSASAASSTFCRRFHLRRKAHSTNSIGAMCSDGLASGGQNDNTTAHYDSVKAEMTDLKLNYKTCCEYRNSLQGKLPKYTGYLSEYGLSREQLQQREQQLQKKQRFVLEQTLRANEDDIRKMQDNERAFTTWLKNKMRYPINKTRNMFDVKLSLNGRRKTKTPTTTAQTQSVANTNTNIITTTTTAATNNNHKNQRRSPFGCAAK